MRRWRFKFRKENYNKTVSGGSSTINYEKKRIQGKPVKNHSENITHYQSKNLCFCVQLKEKRIYKIYPYKYTNKMKERKFMKMKSYA